MSKNMKFITSKYEFLAFYHSLVRNLIASVDNPTWILDGRLYEEIRKLFLVNTSGQLSLYNNCDYSKEFHHCNDWENRWKNKEKSNIGNKISKHAENFALELPLNSFFS